MDYSDYWVGVWGERERNGYYPLRYADIYHCLGVPYDQQVLDVGGGDGHFSTYIGVPDADIIDCSVSGMKVAKEKSPFRTLYYHDIETPFPIASESYDYAICAEVLEHLHKPGVTLSETWRVLRHGGTLLLCQPNMRPDGVHHVRRFYKQDVLDILKSCGFTLQYMWYVPGFIDRAAIWDDIKRSSWPRKLKQTVALGISLLPRPVLRWLARTWPDRFCLIFVVRARKVTRGGFTPHRV